MRKLDGWPGMWTWELAALILGPDTVALSGRWRWVPKFVVPTWEVRYGNILTVDRIDSGVFKAVRFYSSDTAFRLLFAPRNPGCADEILRICHARGVAHVVHSPLALNSWAMDGPVWFHWPWSQP
jgi:hypothetical protein